MNDTKKIILKVLSEIACGNTGTCQINMQSESAREMVADKIMEQLEPYLKLETQSIIEQVLLG